MNDEEAENMNAKGSFSFWSLLLTLYFQDMLPLTDLKKMMYLETNMPYLCRSLMHL